MTFSGFMANNTFEDVKIDYDNKLAKAIKKIRQGK